MRKCFLFLQQLLPPQEYNRQYGDKDRNQHSEGEAPNGVLHTVEEVHTECRGDEGREHQDDGHRGESTHRSVGGVVDDTLIGVHRRFQNV